MLKSSLKSIVAITIYYLIIYLIEKISFFILLKDEFLDLDTIYFFLIETFVFVFLITISILYINKTFPIANKKDIVKYKFVFTVITAAILLRILGDPILRINYIIDGLSIKDKTHINLGPISEYAVLFLNTVLLSSVFEELFFRRIILNFFTSKNIFYGIFISTILFTSIHLNFQSIDVLNAITVFIFGFIAGIIYIRFNLFYSILFHISYNLIWFFMKIGIIKYWALLKELNFGYIYWILITISFIFIVYFLYKSIKRITSSPSNLNNELIQS